MSPLCKAINTTKQEKRIFKGVLIWGGGSCLGVSLHLQVTCVDAGGVLLASTS